jgi:hypothetical protein
MPEVEGSVKEHKSVHITASLLLDRFGACQSGIDKIEHLLPAVISTDPEDNAKLAFALVLASDPMSGGDHDHARRCSACCGTIWLVEKLVERDARSEWEDSPASDLPMLHQQWLAWIADKLLSEHGE